MSTIDYSKWDKIDCSSSDDDDDDNDDDQGSHGLAKPRVTRLDAPSRVTRTSNGDLVIVEQEDDTASENNSNINDTASSKPVSYESKLPEKEPPSSMAASWTRNGSQHVVPSSQQTLYWSQDRSSVCLRVSLPCANNRGKDIQVHFQGIRRYRDRFMAVGNSLPASIRVTCRNNNNDDNSQPVMVLLEGDFPHPIHASEDDEDYVDEDTVYVSSDWSIDRPTITSAADDQHQPPPETAYWVMTVSKAVPMEGVVIWWRRPLTQFPEMDAQQANPNLATQKSQAFQQAWEEAHRQFQEKSKQKVTLP